MSPEVVIKVSNLSKCYHVYEKPHDRLLQMFMRGRKQYYRINGFIIAAQLNL